jgi:hypothetical protein
MFLSSYESNCGIAHSRRMRIRIDAIVVEPIVDRCGLAFEQEDSRRGPPLAYKMRNLGCLSWLRMEHEDDECIGLLIVEIYSAGSQRISRSPLLTAGALYATHIARAPRRPGESEVASSPRRQGTDRLDLAWSPRIMLAVAGDEDQSPGSRNLRSG